jgi:predicted nucleotidyltransferase component of viral defense system
MTLARQALEREAAATGFPAEALEKVIWLLRLLDALRSHPFLKGRIALKGGTALNLFVFDVPRLSVDIDLNYVGARDRDVMLAERPRLEKAIQAVCRREGLAVKHAPTEHAGGKWRLGFASVLHPGGTLELDVNFLLRTPLWPVRIQGSRPVGSFRATRVPLLDVHELAGGKLAALFARMACRDVFDVVELFRSGELDQTRLRLAFVVYGGANRRDWRTVSENDVRLEAATVRRELLPTLRTRSRGEHTDAVVCAERLARECREGLALLLPLRSEEREFLTLLNDMGRIAPDLLTSDDGIKDTIREHPALLWKASNAGRR